MLCDGQKVGQLRSMGASLQDAFYAHAERVGRDSLVLVLSVQGDVAVIELDGVQLWHSQNDKAYLAPTDDGDEELTVDYLMSRWREHMEELLVVTPPNLSGADS